MAIDDHSYIYSINGLFLKRGQTSPTIVEDINEFIRIAPTLADNVRSSLYDRKDAYWFIQHMSMVQFLLKSVGAKWLLTDAEVITRSAEAGHLDLCRRRIDTFISDFLSLSVDMQMAQKRAAESHGEDRKRGIEAYTDIVNILTAVTRLLDNNEYGKARDLLLDIDDLCDDDAVGELLQSFKPGGCAAAENRVKQMRDMYLEQIREMDSIGEEHRYEILAVDDRPDVLRMVAGVLRERYKILTTTDGTSALKILQKKTPDLFILDIDMPGMDGFDLARNIRALERHGKTPILFLTSNSTRDYLLKAIKCGGSDFIVKPAKQSTLLSKVGRYLST